MENLIRSHLQIMELPPGKLAGNCEEWPCSSEAENSSQTVGERKNILLAATTQAPIQEGIVHSPYKQSKTVLLSFSEFLTEKLRPHGNRIALTDGERSVTYKQLLKKFRCCAAMFQAHHVGPGDKVYCHLENSIEAFVALYSIGVAGATVVLSDPEYKEGEVQQHMKNCDATCVVTDLRHSFKFSPGDRDNGIKAYFAVGDVPGFISISNFDTYNEEDYQEVRRCPGRVLVMAYTSGTSGQSKSVEITEERFLRKVCGMEVTGLYSADDVCLACEYLTIYLSFSFNFKFICCGARLVISDKYWSVRDFLSTAKNEKVSFLMTTPSVLYLLASAVAATGTRLPSLRKVVSLGGTLPKSTAGLVISALKPTEFRNVYGLSEASGVVCCPPAGQLCFDSVGFPVADTQVKICDPKSKKTMAPLERGEIMVRSPNMMVGYYNHCEATAAALDVDGWLCTGDMGYYDVSGLLFVTERLKSVIKCLDTKVEPFEVEQCVLELHYVAEVAVLGVAHPVLGEAPAAIVVLRREWKAEKQCHIAKRIKEHVAERLAIYKGLHGGIAFAEELPKNRRGKLLKHLLMTEFVKLKKAGTFY
ncbi:uncharacterized protein LOC119458356 isoform X6 [Dermacentor silvarum]|uniref:uncharacterized protein LOC119458356 isoform X2 n=1 Tax=Dermacentor silvarum TaxID=543639 RepID=UPI0021007B0A|nr:uncharacterized protein LOC119458356 isoform X2 [Dermacentor silvarum]XP_049527072.1 uncharacterized protein LOC119458356 isoform X4 [Dermacentor silvarum]XP_049527073.1 uncharacterized protein LOC119458356 isoform X5 [Dermacentor silvarum]XP_049527074.1 uncharacterized protein LOC119458356 isoform X6 [Dermacentor silvarum]